MSFKINIVSTANAIAVGVAPVSSTAAQHEVGLIAKTEGNPFFLKMRKHAQAKSAELGLQLMQDVMARGLPIVLISHNMPHVFEVSDRIHIHRLGRRLCVIDPKDYSMSDAVAFITGAKEPPKEATAA